jgi:Polyketide cyclase / dehydrase and lipid transport
VSRIVPSPTRTVTVIVVTMWARESSVETSAAPEEVWRLWVDVEGWPDWNADIERIELIGEFAAGSRILMTPFGQEQVELIIAEVDEPEMFVDEVNLGDLVVRTIHRAQRVERGRTRVTYRMEITGLAGDQLGPRIGPEASSDFPQILAALVARAES